MEESKSPEDKDKVIKNLMNSIKVLQKEKYDLVHNSKSEVRVKTIQSLRDERKDQEQVIKLLRKRLGSEYEVDEYLMKNFEKMGEDHPPTYEELKIRLKRLKSEILRLKSSKKAVKKEVVDKEEVEQEIRKRLKDDSEMLHMQIEDLQRENSRIQKAKDNLEHIHTELYEKLQEYNKEMNSMKSVYDVLKDNIRREFEQKNTETVKENEELKRDKEALARRIEEVLKYSNEKLESVVEENEALKHQNASFKALLDGKQTEIDVLVDEIKDYKKIFENSDVRLASQTKKLKSKIDSQNIEISELTAKLSSLEGLVKQKDKRTVNYDDIISEKDAEIEDLKLEMELLYSKIDEMERVIAKEKN